MAEDNFIEVRDLRRQIGSQKILQGVNLDIPRGKTTVILGRSGEGKSVLLKHLIGLMEPDSGSIKIDGTEIVDLPEREVFPTRRKLGVLFQDGALFDSMTVAENVAFPLIERGEKDKKVIHEKVHQALSVVDLAQHLDKMPINISGGMRKRVSLARAIITRPQGIFYDEPTSGLDPVVSDSIDHLVRRLQREYEVTSIVVTHDMKSMFHIADQVAYLRGGKIYFCGDPKDLKTSDDPNIINFINGDSEESLSGDHMWNDHD